MASPTGGYTYYFRDSNGRVSQINGVTKITIATPLVANGYYRDSPPVVVGGAAAASPSDQANISVAGGTTQIITNPAGTVAQNIVAPSSVIQDDAFTHTDLRFIWSPIPLIFFKTVNAITPANPDDTTFSKTRPVGTFDTFDVDCFFWLNEDCAVFNAPPQGFAKTDSYPEITS